MHHQLRFDGALLNRVFKLYSTKGQLVYLLEKLKNNHHQKNNGNPPQQPEIKRTFHKSAINAKLLQHPHLASALQTSSPNTNASQIF